MNVGRRVQIREPGETQRYIDTDTQHIHTCAQSASIKLKRTQKCMRACMHSHKSTTIETYSDTEHETENPKRHIQTETLTDRETEEVPLAGQGRPGQTRPGQQASTLGGPLESFRRAAGVGGCTVQPAHPLFFVVVFVFVFLRYLLNC